MIKTLKEMKDMLADEKLAVDFAVVEGKQHGWKSSAKRIRKFTVDFAIECKKFRAASVAAAKESKPA